MTGRDVAVLPANVGIGCVAPWPLSPALRITTVVVFVKVGTKDRGEWVRVRHL